jgi:hypothetical protein
MILRKWFEKETGRKVLYLNDTADFFGNLEEFESLTCTCSDKEEEETNETNGF